jgi:hypothetical protein
VKIHAIGAGDAELSALDAAIDLYLGNFDLMIEAPTQAITRCTRENFLALQDAVGAHAPWARQELMEVLAIHTQVRRSLTGDAGDLRALQDGHTRAVLALRTFIARAAG